MPGRRAGGLPSPHLAQGSSRQHFGVNVDRESMVPHRRLAWRGPALLTKLTVFPSTTVLIANTFRLISAFGHSPALNTVVSTVFRLSPLCIHLRRIFVVGNNLALDAPNTPTYIICGNMVQNIILPELKWCIAIKLP